MILNKKLYTQQFQTKNFFESDANRWSKRSNFKNNEILNTIQQRNLFVLKKIRKFKIESLIDVGCGSGDLSFEASKIVKKSIGIDFSKNMIDIAKRKFKKKNLDFHYENFFHYSPSDKFDCLSANGFIEYLSMKDIVRFLKVSKKLVKKNRYIIFGTRNRLFNLFSLNKFSENEIKRNSFRNFFDESLELNKLDFKNFIKLKKNKFEEVLFKQPKTAINVDKRHQFSPLQIVDLLKKTKWQPIEFYPINYHPVAPTKYMISKESKLFSNFIYLSDDKNKLPFIPFSSSFMVIAKNN